MKQVTAAAAVRLSRKRTGKVKYRQKELHDTRTAWVSCSLASSSLVMKIILLKDAHVFSRTDPLSATGNRRAAYESIVNKTLFVNEALFHVRMESISGMRVTSGDVTFCRIVSLTVELRV